jgi:hypothetical protein
MESRTRWRSKRERPPTVRARVAIVLLFIPSAQCARFIHPSNTFSTASSAIAIDCARAAGERSREAAQSDLFVADSKRTRADEPISAALLHEK